MLNYFTEVWVFILGLCIGSFLNVCIYRLPESKSIAKPRSMCPNCGTLIRFYDNKVMCGLKENVATAMCRFHFATLWLNY
jgi:ribosomal protein S27AE